MDQLMNAMKAQALLAMGGRAVVRMGTVSSYDPSTYSAKVRIQPEDYETGWLPVGSLWVGNGWGLFCPPSVGDMVEVQHQEDNPECGLVCQRFFNDVDRPLAVPAGEFWLVHAGGQHIKFLNDGTIASHGTWNHAGNLNVTGNTVFTGSVHANGHSIDETHTHGGVAPGGANTGVVT